MNNTELVKKLKEIEVLVNECLDGINSVSSSEKLKPAPKNNRDTGTRSTINIDKIDFSIPIRPFVKKYAKNMSGPKKFVLILAHLSSGNLDKKINLEEVEKIWNSMKSLLGMKFNRFYTQTAKDNDWVTSEKKGIYLLRPSWLEIFK